MTAPPPRRPWWKRKRYAAALALWLMLPVLYPLSAGPAYWLSKRGDLDYELFMEWWMLPIHDGLRTLGVPRREIGIFDRYVMLWDSPGPRTHRR